MVELKDLDSSFCGIILKSGDKHKDTVERPLRLTMAALDASSNKTKEPVVVCYEHNNVEYIVCTLVPGSLYQQQIDLLFVEAEDIIFYLKGKGTVHLSGYYEPMPDEDEFPGLSEGEEDESDFEPSFINDEAEEDEEEEEEEEEKEVSGKKRKLRAAEPQPKKAKLEEKVKTEQPKVEKPAEPKKNGDQETEPSTKNKKKKNKKKKNKKNKADTSASN